MTEITMMDALKDILRGAPEILRMENTSGLLMTAINHWGIENIPSILLNTVKRIGLTNGIKNISRFNLLSVFPAFLPSVWDALGDKEAFACIETSTGFEQRVTYKEFKDKVFRVANGLIGLGLKRKDTVDILSWNRVEYPITEFGVWFAGGITVPVSWHEKGETFLDWMTKRNPKVVIVEDHLIGKVLDIKDKLKTVEKYIVVGDKEKVPEGDEWISWENFLMSSPNEQPPIERFLLGISQYTAGTTGKPKAPAHFQAFESALGGLTELPHGFSSISEMFKYAIHMLSPIYQFGGGKMRMKSLCIGPLYHAIPFYSSIVPFLFPGVPSVLMRRFDPEEVLRLIDREKITMVIAVPTHIYRVVMLPEEVKEKYDLSSLHAFTSCGAPCQPEMKIEIDEFFERRYGKRVFHEYCDAVETGNPSIILKPEDTLENPKRYESVGRARCGDAIVADPVTKEPLPPYKEGIVGQKTFITSAIPGYVEGTAKEDYRNNLFIANGKEYLNSGLVGYMDEDGFVYLTGRAKEMIIVGGVNVYPNEIEFAILKHPAVQDVAVIPIPDKDLGEVVGAVVQLKEGASATEEEIIEHCKKEGLYGYKLPRKVDFWKELPRGPEGKMVKRDIEKKFWEDKGIKRRG